MKLGIGISMFPWTTAEIGPAAARIATAADEAGLDSLWVMDHFLQIRLTGLPPESPMPEAYATLGFLGGLTKRIKLGACVTSVAYRHPGVLVKTVTALDVMTGGRAIFGVGEGAPWNIAPDVARRRESLPRPASVTCCTHPAGPGTMPPSTRLRPSCPTCTPSSPRPADGTIVSARGVPTKGRLAAFGAALAGSAVLGAVAGLIWAAVAPRALLQEVGHGEAQVVNTETSAFIAADGLFCLITVAAGLITGLAGYRLLVRRAGWTAAAGLIIGAVGAVLLALWTGENVGLGSYNHLLAVSAPGTFFSSSLSLGAKSVLVFWPGLTSLVILLSEYGGHDLRSVD